jgi:TRAP-type uncharacterized transport system substrate-binding protein
MMHRLVALVLLATLLAATSVRGFAATTLRMLADSPRDTSMQIGQDIAALAANAADVELEVLPSIVSDGLRRLRYERSIHLALVHADVYQAMLDAAARGDTEAGDIVRPLRVVMPMYHEELHFIVRADSDLAFVDDIRDARLNLGERGSATAHATTALYRLLFDAPPPASSTHLPPEDALVKLITDRSVDVVVVVAGQPAPLIAGMKPEARKFVKLLRLNPDHASSSRVYAKYRPAQLRARSYPNLLSEDLPALGARTVLIANDHDSKPTRDALARLARSVCRNLPVLQRHGHPKWRDINGALPDLGPGWVYHHATAKEINLCIADRLAGDSEPTGAK